MPPLRPAKLPNLGHNPVGSPGSKATPVRTCVGCRCKSPKGELIRLVSSGEGTLKVDPQGHYPGRGAYIHPSKDCWLKAQRRVRSTLALNDRVDLASVDEIVEYLDAF